MDKDAVIAQLASEWNMEPVRDDEITVKDFVEFGIIDLSADTIRNRLDRLEKEGILKKRQARNQSESGGHCSAYSVVEGKTWEDVLQYIKKK